MREFECKGCGTTVYISSGKGKGPVCPACRSVMLFVGNSENRKDFKKFVCSDCKEEFFMRKDEIPYKCPFCNYTFSVSPRLKQEERL
jgi:DNA-directed RNA polymerase subunit RPC12/RpoP